MAHRLNVAKGGILDCKPLKIIVTMGGIDNPNATRKVLEALSKYRDKLDIHVTVLLSEKAPHYNNVNEYSLKHNSWITHLDFVENMAELLSKQSVAIGAPGGSSWERACLGIPSIIIPLAENQSEICHNLVKMKAALRINIGEIESKLTFALDVLINEWKMIRNANLLLCDGSGVFRCVSNISSLLQNDKNSVSLRRAIELDIEQVYQWQCLPETRKYALSPKIPTRKEHQSWMNTKLCSAEDYFYIIERFSDKHSLGVLRLDKDFEGFYVISIFIDPKCFGQGFAKKVLASIDEIHPNITIHATVLEENHASHRLFTTAKYRQLDTENYIRHPLIREENETIHHNR